MESNNYEYDLSDPYTVKFSGELYNDYGYFGDRIVAYVWSFDDNWNFDDVYGYAGMTPNPVMVSGGESVPFSGTIELTDVAPKTYYGLQFYKYANGGWVQLEMYYLYTPSKDSFGPGQSGVEEITDGSEALVEYYNLQGVRVANPEKGRMLIRKAGSKAEKVIM